MSTPAYHIRVSVHAFPLSHTTCNSSDWSTQLSPDNALTAHHEIRFPQHSLLRSKYLENIRCNTLLRLR